jgi:hypothetical protein
MKVYYFQRNDRTVISFSGKQEAEYTMELRFKFIAERDI